MERHDYKSRPVDAVNAFAGLAPYEGKAFSCFAATEKDMGQVDELLRENPMQGWVQLAFSRGALADADPVAQKRLLVLLRPNGAPRDCAAVYALQNFPVYCRGERCEAVYLSLLRVNPEFRGRIAVLRDGYAAIPKFAAQLGWPDRYFTSIAEDNLQARRLLEAGLKQLPRYTPQGLLHTFVFSVRAGAVPGLLQRANAAMLPEIVAFYRKYATSREYAPNLDAYAGDAGMGLGARNFFTARRGGKLIACLALWDRRSVQTVSVAGYRPPLRLLRPAYNVWAKVKKLPVLPPPGRKLEAVFIAFAAFSPAALPETGRIIREALYYAGQDHAAQTALLGLSPDNPAARAATSLPHSRYTTIIETVDWHKSGSAPENALPVQPEIALL